MACMCTALQTLHCSRSTIFFVVFACTATATNVGHVHLVMIMIIETLREELEPTVTSSHSSPSLSDARWRLTISPSCGRRALSDRRSRTASGHTASYLRNRGSKTQHLVVTLRKPHISRVRPQAWAAASEQKYAAPSLALAADRPAARRWAGKQCPVWRQFSKPVHSDRHSKKGAQIDPG